MTEKQQSDKNAIANTSSILFQVNFNMENCRKRVDIVMREVSFRLLI